MPIDKTMESFKEAIKDVFEGATILLGGFGTAGSCPSYLIRALGEQGTKGITIVCNNTGLGREMLQARAKAGGMTLPEWYDDIGFLCENKQVKKAIAAFPVLNSPVFISPFEKLYRAGEAEMELVPQGTLAERIRANKAGIGAFFTPVGPGTVIAEGKETRIIDNRPHVLEYPIKADFAFVRAYKADPFGNLIYRGTSRTFNAAMAGAATVTIAEVDEILPVGGLDPETVVTPAIYVDRVVVRPEEGRHPIVQQLWKKET